MNHCTDRDLDQDCKLACITKNAYAALGANHKIRSGLDFIEADDERTLKNQVSICEIPAPTFGEEARADYYMRQLAALGRDVEMVLQVMYSDFFEALKGTEAPCGSHLDTVFPEGTDVKVRYENGKCCAPESEIIPGLAALLSVIRAFRHTRVKPVGDVIFCAMSEKKD